MFRFSDPQYLYILLSIPLLFAYFICLNKRDKKNLQRYGQAEVLAALMPDVSLVRQYWHFGLQITAIALAIVMIAGPQFGSKLEKQKRHGVELMIAVDVSNSMMAEDIVPSRMEKSKQTLSKLIDHLVNDKIGLVVFAGNAYTQLPITADYVSAKMFLNTLSTDMVPVQGTAIGAAIQLAMRSFNMESEAEKAIIIITDGENHEDDAVTMAQEAQKQGVKIHVIGMGMPKGGPIPTLKHNDYHKDKEGNIVITKLNEEMCRKIAQAGGGLYVRSDNSNAALKMLIGELDKMTKSEIETSVYTEYDEQYQALAWAILLLLLVDMFILDRKNPRIKNIKWF